MPTRSMKLGCVALAFLVAATAPRPPSAWAQEPAPQPPAPSPNPPASPPALPAGSAPDLLLDRLRQMEEKLDALSNQNARLSQENQRLSEQYNDLSRQVQGAAGGSSPSRTGPRSNEGMFGGTGGADSILGGDKSSVSGGGSKTSGGDPTYSGRAQEVGNRHLNPIDLKASYDYEKDGFGFASRDDELELRVRAMTQVDARIFSPTNQSPVSSGIYNPRSRIYFEGHFTKPIQYEFSFQNTFDVVGLLDAYVNFNYDPRFNFRLGRYKAPFAYEWYRVHIWDLLAPERSLFSNNFEANRRFGAMAWGSVFDQRLEYAVGSFNGQRNSYSAFNNTQDVIAFVNFKPFDPYENSPLRNFQVGGSVDAGDENNPLTPAVITTSSPPSPLPLTGGSASTAANVPILAFNSGVRERGERALWELHSAYFYKGLSLLAAWDSGYQNYAKGTSGPAPVKVATSGYFVQAGYLVTGETIRDRTLVDPLRPFDLRKGRFGLGALELTARYSELELGQSVFNGGLANPNIWSRKAQMVDVGFNWYLNKFVKMYFDWEHAMFGTPVQYRPGALTSTNNLYWLRFQVYF